MSPEFMPLFQRLRGILERHAAWLAVGQDKADYYGLEAPVGPATLRAWGGKMKSSTIPVAWVTCGKGYVSCHLMGVYAQPKLLENCSKELRARMQGKSCFNFKMVDEELFAELERLTSECLMGMKTAGYIGEQKAG